MTKAFDDRARERDALYQADVWYADHPLEVAINCEQLAMRDKRAADRLLADAQWWLDKRDKALAEARKEVEPG